MALRVVLVEDQKMFLQLLEGILQANENLEVVASVATVAEGVEACERHKPDLLILDLQLPDGNGLAVARQLSVSNPAGKVIILSGHASAFVCPPDLLHVIQAVVEKTKAYAALQEQIQLLLPATAAPSRRAAASPDKVLTDREQEIFKMIGRGKSNREIAHHFGLSEHTIKTHRKRIANKLNLRGAALIHKATLHHQPAGR